MAKDRFYLQYRDWLGQFLNLYDYALEQPGYRKSNQDLEYFRNNPKEPYYVRSKLEPGTHFLRKVKIFHPNKISGAMLQRHMEQPQVKATRLYAANEAAATRMMFQLDFDFHEKHKTSGLPNETRQMADLINWTIFEGQVYAEPSSGMDGTHGYFFVDVQYIKRENIKGLIKTLKDIIQAAVTQEERTRGHPWGGSFDAIQMQPTIWSLVDPEETYDAEGNEKPKIWKIEEGNRCLLGKVPRLNGFSMTREESWDALKQASMGALDSFVSDLMGRIYIAPETPLAPEEPPECVKEGGTRREELYLADTIPLIHIESAVTPGEMVVQPRRISDIQKLDSAFLRMNAAAGMLSSRLNRGPKWEELIEFYEKQGCNRNPVRTPRRVARAKSCASFWERTFDPSRAHTERFKADQDDLVKIIQAKLEACGAYKGGHGKYRAYDILELAAGYQFCREQLKSWVGHEWNTTLPRAGIMARINVLHKHGLLPREFSEKRAGSMRRELERLGLIQCIDQEYGPKMAKKYKLVDPKEPMPRKMPA